MSLQIFGCVEAPIFRVSVLVFFAVFLHSFSDDLCLGCRSPYASFLTVLGSTAAPKIA